MVAHGETEHMLRTLELKSKSPRVVRHLFSLYQLEGKLSVFVESYWTEARLLRWRFGAAASATSQLVADDQREATRQANSKKKTTVVLKKNKKLIDETEREIASTYIELHCALLCRDHGNRSCDREMLWNGSILHKFSNLGVKNR